MGQETAYDKSSILNSLGLGTSESTVNESEKTEKPQSDNDEKNKLLCPYCEKELIKVPGRGYMHKNKQQTACKHKLFKTIKNIEAAAEEVKRMKSEPQEEKQSVSEKKNSFHKKEKPARKKEDDENRGETNKREETPIEVIGTKELLQRFTPEQIEEMKKMLQSEEYKEPEKAKTFVPLNEKPQELEKEELQKEVIPEVKEEKPEKPEKNAVSKMPRASSNTKKALHKGLKRTITITQHEKEDNFEEEKQTEKKEYVQESIEKDFFAEIENEFTAANEDNDQKGNDGKTKLLNTPERSYQIKRPFLVQISTGEIIEVKKAYFVVGKGKEADFITDNEFISRSHIAIIGKNDTYYIKDLNSSNGTFLNDFRIPPQTEVEIKDNNTFVLANESFEFHYEV